MCGCRLHVACTHTGIERCLQVEKVCVMIYMIKVCNVKSTW